MNAEKLKENMLVPKWLVGLATTLIGVLSIGATTSVGWTYGEISAQGKKIVSLEQQVLSIKESIESSTKSIEDKIDTNKELIIERIDSLEGRVVRMENAIWGVRVIK